MFDKITTIRQPTYKIYFQQEEYVILMSVINVVNISRINVKNASLEHILNSR